MATVSDILAREPDDDESSLRYNETQVHIIETALENPEKSASDLHRLLQDDMGEDAPSQGYIYSVLKRATSHEYKAATGQLEQAEESTETDSVEGESQEPEGDEESSERAGATVSRSGGTINISISIPEDAELDVEVEEEEEKEEEAVPA